MRTLPQDWTFFGLTPKYNVAIHQEVGDLAYYAKGIDWHTAYNLPVFLRRFHIHRINKIHEDINNRQKKK